MSNMATLPIFMVITFTLIAAALVIALAISIHNRPPSLEYLKNTTDIHQLIKAAHYYVDIPNAPAIRAEAIRTLGHIGNPEAVEALIKALNTPDADARRAIITALGASRSSQAIAPLINLLKNPATFKNKPLHEELQRVLRTFGQAGAQLLRQAFAEGPDSVKIATAHIMADMAGEQVLDTLIAGLNTTNPNVETAVTQALTKIGPEAAKKLLPSLNHAAPSIRANTAIILGHIANPVAMDPLIDRLEQEDDLPARQAIVTALDTLGWKPANSTAGAIYWIAKHRWDQCAALGQKAIDPLLKVIRAPDAEQETKHQATQTLAKIGKPALLTLTQLLTHQDPLIRQLAAAALGTLGDESTLDALTQVTTDHSWQVRLAAVQALGEIGVPQSFEAVLNTLKDSMPDIRIAALAALAKIGGPKAESQLIKVLLGSDRAIHPYAAQALDTLGWRPDFTETSAAYRIAKKQWKQCVAIGRPAVKPLMAALPNAERADRKAIAETLAAIGDPRAKNAMVIYWIDENEWDKCIELGANAVPALVAALDDHPNRADIIGVLGEIGEAKAVEPLCALLNDPEPAVGEAAVAALIKIRKPAVPAMLHIIQDTTDRHPVQVKQAAIHILGELMAPQAIGPLLSVFQSKADASLRKAAAETLGMLGDKRAIEPMLAAMKNDQEAWEIRKAATLTLGRLKAAKTTPQLIHTLNGWQELGYLRQAAAEALGNMGDDRAIEPLLNSLKEKNFVDTVVEALSKIKSNKAVEPLIDLLDSTDRTLVIAAGDALKNITGKKFGAERAQWDRWWRTQRR